MGICNVEYQRWSQGINEQLNPNVLRNDISYKYPNPRVSVVKGVPENGMGMCKNKIECRCSLHKTATVPYGPILVT